MKFSEISLLITHYNRSYSLENLLRAFAELDCEFGDIIVSDDGSRVEHIDNILQLQKCYGFKLITTERNRGLGNNINKGQDAVRTPFTLYVQEDFEPRLLFPEKLIDGLTLLEENRDLDIVRYYAYGMYPYTTPFNKDFSFMKMNPLGLNYRKVYCYSDHPHLRRSTFFEKFGRYREGLKVEKTEFEMCLAFIHNKGKGVFYNNFQELFFQRNTVSEPSTVNRESWRRSNNYFIKKVRDLYRQIKYNFYISISPLLKMK